MEKIDHVLDLKNVLYTELYKVEPLDREEIYAKLMEYKELIAPYVADTFTILHNAVKEGKTILLEGQLGSLKDPDLGIYPMVTSSSPVAGFGAVVQAVSRRMKSKRFTRSLRRIPALSAQASSFPRFSAMKRKS